MKIIGKILPFSILIVIVFLSSIIRAEDPDFLTISGGLFDFNRNKDDGGEFRLEYRSNKKYLGFKPFAIRTNLDDQKS